MLEKMFPKSGSDVPEIRFKEFTGGWKEQKLGEIADNLDYGLNAAAIKFDGINKYIRITDIDDENNEFKTDALTSPDTNLSNAGDFRLKEGDLLFARTGASVGKTYFYKISDGVVFFAGFLIRARIKPEYDPVFIFQNTLTNKYKSFIRFTSQRSGQPGVNAQEYSSFEIFTPILSEQAKIGAFFKQLDNLLSFQKKELEKLKTMKKALLEKMFV
ncbi:MAG: restriction endonuclease subunit S [Bacteroidetes bacterium]|nr:restriction endonuclease subunit S [Bacteroidota bacterium]